MSIENEADSAPSPASSQWMMINRIWCQSLHNLPLNYHPFENTKRLFHGRKSMTQWPVILPGPSLITKPGKIAGLKCICFPSMCREDDILLTTVSG
jgi:hypothetical protein